MKTFLLNIIIFTLFITQTSGQTIKSKDFSAQDAEKMIKEFYSQYIIENEKSITNDKYIESLKKKYITEDLIKKIKTIKSDYDVITNSQDYDKNWLKTLKVEKTSNNDYTLTYSNEQPIKLIVLYSNGVYKINGIGNVLVTKTNNNSINKNKDSGTNIDTSNHKKIDFYEHNDNYFIKDIDVNKDGFKDKVVSSTRNKGEKLIVFLNKNNEFNFNFESTNFSEDGGNQIADIKESQNGFIIKTAFPDRGFFEKEYYIKNVNKNWILEKIVYKTNSTVDYTTIYVCDVAQNIYMNTPNFYNKINDIPEENNRKKVCSVQYQFEENDVKQYLIRFKNNNKNIVRDNKRYESMLKQFPLTLQNSSEYNDIGFYLEQHKYYNEAIFLLKEISKKYPDRIVVWLNLGDAQFGNKDIVNAKKSYLKYIELMKTQGKDLNKIPKRVYDRIK